MLLLKYLNISLLFYYPKPAVLKYSIYDFKQKMLLDTCIVCLSLKKENKLWIVLDPT